MHAGVEPRLCDRVHAGIDDLLEADPSSLSDEELRGAVVDIYRADARLAAARSRYLAETDQRQAYAELGAQSTAAFTTKECRLPGGVARHHVQVARALRHLPVTLEKLADGELTAWHAARLARQFHNPRVRERLEADEAMLVGEAVRLPFALFERVLAYWAQLADPDGTEEDAEAARARRRLHLSRTLDGCFVLDGLLDPVSGTILFEALKRIDDELWEHDRREAQALGGGEEPVVAATLRSGPQRRADALVELARRATAMAPGTRRPQPLISVLCSYETFAGRICELADGTVVAPGIVASLLDEALIERVVFDGPSRVLDISHQRLFTGALRRAIQLRDRVCQHPYCDRPADRSHVDHRIRFTDGGPTTQENGRPYCSFHNQLRERRPDSMIHDRGFEGRRASAEWV